MHNYDEGRWYKIEEDYEAEAAQLSIASQTHGPTSGGNSLWNESDLIEYMSGVVQEALCQTTRERQLQHISQLVENVKHKLPQELYEKSLATFAETL